MSTQYCENLNIRECEQKGGEKLCILSNIEELMRQQGKTQRELCRYLGVSASVYSQWKAETSDSYMKHIPKIAKFFGVPIARIYGEGGTPQQFALNKLLESLTPDQIKAVEAFIKAYTEHSQK